MFRRSKFAFLNTKDDRIKIINERINLTEKHLVEICASFASCTRKLAKFRDSYDELSKCFKNFSDEEEINESFSDGMKMFTNAVTILADYMDLNVRRLELKIVNELAQFDSLCKTTRDNLRTAVIARDKEVLKQRQMLELKSKFSANNSAADSELLKAKMEVSRTNKEIDEIIYNFERRKLNDVKKIFVDFVLISMKYHTKCLEVLSSSYYDVTNIDERGDFFEFQKIMKSKTEAQEKKSSKKKTASLRSQSMESLERDQVLSPLKGSSRISKSTKNLSESKTDEDDDDNDDDDEEDEEDEDEEEEEEDDENEEDDDEDASDTSNSDGESVSEAEDVEEAIDLDKASNSKAHKLNLKKPLNKSRAQHPFKAAAATHVLKKSSKRQKNVFVTKRLAGCNATGIPRLVTRKRDEHLSASARKGRDSNAITTHNSSGGGSRSLVTVVESKNKASVDENVIDCTHNFRN